MDGEEREWLGGLILRLATKIVYSVRSTEVHQQQQLWRLFCPIAYFHPNTRTHYLHDYATLEWLDLPPCLASFLYLPKH